MLSVTSARKLAAENIQKAQAKYKKSYDRVMKSRHTTLKTGDWVLVYFPQDDSGKNRKLSRPWHGPYRITSLDSPDVCVAKVYFPQDPQIRVHQTRMKACPPNFPAGFYWYGGRRRGPGRPPKWVEPLLDQHMVGEPGDEPAGEQPNDEAENDPSDAEEEDEAADDPSDVEESVTENPTAATGTEMPRTRPPCKYPLRSRSGRTS